MKYSANIPQTFGIENDFLSAMIAAPDFIAEARKIITREVFDNSDNAAIWDILCQMDDTGATINWKTIYKQPINTQHFQTYLLDNAGNPRSYMEMMELTSTLNAAAYKRSTCIKAIDLLSLTQGSGTAEQIDAAINNLVKAKESQTISERTTPVKTVLDILRTELEEHNELVQSGKLSRIPTSFPSLDRATYGGFAPGNLIVLAARPSIGKTAFMLQFARNAAHCGFASTVISLEMMNTELAQRMINSTSLVTMREMLNGTANLEHYDRAAERFSELPLYFNESVRGFNEICHEITVAHKRGRCDIAFIDYLGLIEYPDQRASVNNQVAAMTKRFKSLAKELRIPIILLCQLNREQDKEKRAPELRDLRDSGAIEQDADIVLMLQRDKFAESEEDARKTTIWVRKHRNGEVGKIETMMDKTYTNIYEINPKD